MAETEKAEAQARAAQPLKDAIRDARIEAAERSAVVVDMRDADLARLEILNDALDPVFAEVPAGVDLFDRGISRGDTPRLWIDVLAHVTMGRDKRLYRFVQDTRYGRTTLAESYETRDIAEAVTRYVARRLVERERALSDDAAQGEVVARRNAVHAKRARRWRSFRAFLLGIVIGVIGLVALAILYPNL
ncbi:MAG: hypothetical protein AB7T86_02855 [Xanthobacteraceae bacterium]|uniref:hypothetical protein n=1 Tax=Pseudolabrys sp. TaxID=1960880 RepID=UPI003D112028